ncbi:MAG: hypothetical protein ACR2G4_11990 [Pyrinomonadaceae bacterium]
MLEDGTASAGGWAGGVSRRFAFAGAGEVATGISDSDRCAGATGAAVEGRVAFLRFVLFCAGASIAAL